MRITARLKQLKKKVLTHLLLFEFLKVPEFVAEKHVRKTDSEVISLKQGGDICMYINTVSLNCFGSIWDVRSNWQDPPDVGEFINLFGVQFYSNFGSSIGIFFLGL